MSGKKKGSMTILTVCIVLLVLGVAGCVAAAKIEEGGMLLGWGKQMWETVSLSCLNAGWIGALIVYIAGRRR